MNKNTIKKKKVSDLLKKAGVPFNDEIELSNIKIIQQKAREIRLCRSNQVFSQGNVLQYWSVKSFIPAAVYLLFILLGSAQFHATAIEMARMQFTLAGMLSLLYLPLIFANSNPSQLELESTYLIQPGVMVFMRFILTMVISIPIISLVQFFTHSTVTPNGSFLPVIFAFGGNLVFMALGLIVFYMCRMLNPYLTSNILWIIWAGAMIFT